MSLESSLLAEEDEPNIVPISTTSTSTLPLTTHHGSHSQTHTQPPSSTSTSTSTTPSIDRSGFLTLIDGDQQTTYWCVLSGNEMRYYTSQQTQIESGSISLEGSTVEIAPDSRYSRSWCFELSLPQVTTRVWVWSAQQATEMQDWMNAIRRVMLRIRREKSKQVSKRRLSDDPSNPLHPSTANSTSHDTSLSVPTPTPAAAISSHTAATPFQYSQQASAPVGGVNIQPLTPATSTSNPSNHETIENRHEMYARWLQETRSQRAGGAGSRSTRDGDGSVLHRHLLNEQEDANKCCGGRCTCPMPRCIIM